MKKIVIKECRQCPHYMQEGFSTYFCYLTEEDLNENFEILDTCPLEDD